MAQRKAVKVNFETPAGINEVFSGKDDSLKVERVYTAVNGLLKVDQKHDTRFNLVLPEQLYRTFEAITEREVGRRERTSVIEHLMIEYCREHGAVIVNKRED